jgi:hypothetical protein
LAVRADAARVLHLPPSRLIEQDGAVDFSSDPRVAVMVGQYVWQNDNQIGGMRLLDERYGLGKIIEFNETQVYPQGYANGDRVSASRAEAWEFIVGGGAGFNQLNGLYLVGNEDASGTGNEVILRQLRLLREFMDSFDFVKMRRDPGLLAGDPPAGAFVRGMSETGKQYALYIHHSRNPSQRDSLFLYYEVLPGAYRDKLDLRLEPGRYRAEWVLPSTGKTLSAERFEHKRGPRRLTTPQYEIDLALRIKRER